MRGTRRPVLLAVFSVLGALVAPVSGARELTFEDRVRAQEAIERVYYSHQIGTTRPFDAAVPRDALVQKVRAYVEQTAALERFWNTTVTGEALRLELERMVRGTRMPGRLRELFAALDDDPSLIEECLARPALVGRLVRNFFDYDERFHAETHREAERLREALREGRVDPWTEDPRRTVLEVASAEIVPLREEREAFVVTVVLDAEPDRIRAASFAVAKRSYEEWWNEARGDLHAVAAESVAVGPDPIPGLVQVLRNRAEPFAGTQSGDPLPSGWPCAADDTWHNGILDDAPFPTRQPESTWTGSLMLVPDVGRYDPATDTWSPISKILAPPLVGARTAVWTGQEMIVWGGGATGGPAGASITNEGGRYDPLTDTWTPTSIASAPSPRLDHVAVWAGSSMLVWGGYDGALLGDGARYDPESDTWTPISAVDAPAPRRKHVAVWTESVMVVWGGAGPGTGLNTGGRYDPDTDSWSPTSFEGAPSPRAQHEAVWTGSVMVVWGGEDNDNPSLNTGGRYDPAQDAWLGPTSTANAPAARLFHTATWTGEHMLVWGGTTSLQGVNLRTGAAYDPADDTWTPMSETNAPSPRALHTAVWTGNLLVVWGGFENGGTTNTGGRYDPAADGWTPTYVTGAPKARAGHTAVWTGNQMIVWGGGPYQGYLDTGGRLDLLTDTWTPTSTVNAPSGRYGHTAVWTGQEMVVWGGSGPPSTGPQDSGGRYDPLADSWVATSTVHPPVPRRDHTAVWTGDQMIVWGGTNSAGSLASGGRYDPATDTWLAPTSMANAPAPRGRHKAVWTGSQMIVWGGGSVNTPIGTGARYNPATNTWAPTSLSGAPAPRVDHTAVWTGNRMIVWGGAGGFTPLASGSRYDPLTDTWLPTSAVDAPAARWGHTAVWTGASMVVWSGTNQDFNTGVADVLESGGRYDATADSWQPTATADVPLPRYRHTAVWTGGLMIVWGGFFSPLDAGAVEGGGRYALGNAVDDDGDGLSECAGDCNDVAAGAFALPPEVTGAGFGEDKLTLFWNSAAPAAGSATVHDVLRGPLSALGTGSRETCLEGDLSGASVVDPETPGAASGFWYLVRGRNVCGAGTYGYASDGTETTSLACP